MRWLLLFLVMISGSVGAQEPIQSINFGQVCPGTSPICQPTVPRKIISFSFLGSVPSVFTFTRASTGWYFNSSGLLTSAGNDVARFDYAVPGGSTLFGLLAEKASTNKLLWSRDFTQASWTATNITTALDQTGIDGVASSASSLAATASNGTICQSVTQAATLSSFSVYLKRISGTGTISLSQDNGSTYSTVAVTSSWTRFAHATQSTLNPTMCIKIATSGDSIAADVAQFETGTGGDFSYPTSPIVTTNATVTRAADSLTINPTWYNVNGGAFVYQFEQPSFAGANVSLGGFNGTGGYGWNTNNGNLTVAGGIVGTALINSPNTIGLTYTGPGGVTNTAFNGVLKSNASALAGTPSALTLGGGSSWVRSFTYWNFPLTGAQLATATR